MLTGTNAGIVSVGTIDTLIFRDFKIQGDGVIGSAQWGINNASGQTLSRIIVQNLEVWNTTIGISVNAYLSGSVDNVIIEGNYCHDIVGSDPGTGYGIHASKATNVRISNNLLDNCSRHSIYQAAGVAHTIIHDNIIKNHRKDVDAGTYHAAIAAGRGSRVSIVDNILIDGYDGGILFAQVDSDSLGAQDSIIQGNQLIGRKNASPDIIIGEKTVPTSYFTSNVSVIGNVFHTDYGECGAGGNILVVNGTEIKISDNLHYWEGIDDDTATIPIIGIGHDTYISEASHCTNIDVSNNYITAEGILRSKVIGVYVASEICGYTSNVRIKNNTFKGMAIDVYFSGALTNPNILYDTRKKTLGSAAPTTGTWERGDIVWDSTPTSGAAPGWICTESGTFSAATDGTGDTDGSTAVITGMTDTSDFSIGDYVDVSAGFPTTGPYKVYGLTATTMTISGNSNSAETNITVDTSDPVFKAMANLA